MLEIETMTIDETERNGQVSITQVTNESSTASASDLTASASEITASVTTVTKRKKKVEKVWFTSDSIVNESVLTINPVMTYNIRLIVMSYQVLQP